MKNDDSHPFEAAADEAAEARIVAWMLGEASAFEVTELERLCAKRPELEKFRQMMIELHGLLDEAETMKPAAEWKLSFEKRRALNDILRSDEPVRIERPLVPMRKRKWNRWHASGAIAAGLTAAFVTLQFSRTGSFLNAGPETADLPRSPALREASDSIEELKAAVRQQEHRVEERREALANVVRQKGIAYRSEESMFSSGGSDDAQAARQPQTQSAFPVTGSQDITAAGVRSGDQAINLNSIDAILNNPDRNSISELSVPPADREIDLQAKSETESLEIGDVNASDYLSQNLKYHDQTRDGGDISAPVPEQSQMRREDDPQTALTDKIRRDLYVAEGSFNLGKYDEAKKAYEKVIQTDPYNSTARRGLEKISGVQTDYYRAAYDQTRAELLMQVDKALELQVPSESKDTADVRKSAAAFDEIAAEAEPFSTFSLSVGDVSFQLAKAALERGGQPTAESIKAEQFYNAVDYSDPSPGTGEPVAGVVEQSAHPVIPGRNLVRVGLRTGATGRAASQPLRLTLLVDQSGSMLRDDRREAMQQAVGELAKLLTAADRISVIGFSRTSHLLAEGLAGDQAATLVERVTEGATEGGTNLEEAMKLGETIARRHLFDGAQNRVVLFTDGAANLGDADPARLAEMVKSMRGNGIAFDIAGIGAEGLNDRLLGELARNGNGRYYVAAENFANQLAGAFRPSAEDAKVQVKFNPARVSHYKLIGFEENRLKTEDFRNDAVDAGELAAEEAAVALYQVQLKPEGSGEIGEVSVRFREAGSGVTVERSWTIPHDPAAPAFDKASPSMQLAGLSMMAAEKLKGGAMADAVDFKNFAGPVSKIREYYKNSRKAADMLRIIEMLTR